MLPKRSAIVPLTAPIGLSKRSRREARLRTAYNFCFAILLVWPEWCERGGVYWKRRQIFSQLSGPSISLTQTAFCVLAIERCWTLVRVVGQRKPGTRVISLSSLAQPARWRVTKEPRFSASALRVSWANRTIAMRAAPQIAIALSAALAKMLRRKGDQLALFSQVKLKRYQPATWTLAPAPASNWHDDEIEIGSICVSQNLSRLRASSQASG